MVEKKRTLKAREESNCFINAFFFFFKSYSDVGNFILLSSLLVRLLKLVLFRVCPELSSLSLLFPTIITVIPIVSTIIYLLMTPKLIPQVQIFLLTYAFNRLINSST